MVWKNLKCMKYVLPLTLLSTGGFAAEIAVTQDNAMNRPLGNGYDAKKEMLVGQCVEGKSSLDVPDEGSVSQGNLKLHIEMDESSTADKLGVAVGGKARIGVVSYRASAQYATESMNTGMSLSYVYSADYLYNAYLVNSSSSPVTTRPGMGAYLQDGANWLKNCGDEYTFAVDKGARLFLSLRMDFVSKSEKSRFAAQFGVEGPLFSAEGSFEKAHSNYSKNTQLTISALQMGGDPAKLGSIFCPPVGPTGQPNPNCLADAKKAISCSFGDLGPCIEVMTQMVAYGNSQDPSSFAGQIKDFRNYNTLRLYTQPWSYLGSQFPLPPTPQDIQNYETNQKILADLFEENYRNFATAYRYWRGKAPRLSDGENRQKDQMGILQAEFKTNMSTIAEAIRACYESPMLCESKMKTAKLRIKFETRDYRNEKSIEALLVPETYAQYCDLLLSDQQLRKTIEALNQVALIKSEMTAEAFNKGDSCFRAQDILQTMEELDLSDKALSDLRPVASLLRLKKLNLSRNSFRDISSLSALKELEELKLDDNTFRDVRPLAELGRLKILSLQNVGATDVSSLAGLNLKVLDLRRNRPALNCPMPSASTCRTVDFAEQGTFMPLDRIGGYYTPRVGQAVASTRFGALITGGVDSLGNTMAHVESFDESNLRFEVGPSMKYARVQHTATALQDGRHVLLAGGGEFSNTYEVYDLFDSQPSKVEGRLNQPRTAHTATILADGRVLIVGGFTRGTSPVDARSDATNTAEIFDPRSMTRTSPTESMALPRALHASVLLKDGRVLVSGGYLNGSSLDSLEIFDPRTNHFSRARASMHVGRSAHSMNLLTDGRVLIAGGYSRNNLAVTSAEIFDPVKEEMIRLEPMEKARGAHIGITLDNGKVLLAGGSNSYSGGISNKFDHNGQSMAEVEIYDPATQSFSPMNTMVKARSFAVVLPLINHRLLVLGGMGSEASAKTAELFDYGRMP